MKKPVQAYEKNPKMTCLSEFIISFVKHELQSERDNEDIRLIYQFEILFNEIKPYKKFINEFESMRKSEYHSKIRWSG